VLIGIASIGTLGITATSHAQEVARSFVASPDVYKLISENDQYRVIASTWKPGQRDNWHSHGSTVAGYRLTDCNLRVHTPDGKSTESSTKSGAALIGAASSSHSFENIGKEECKLVLFEPK
jgi:mannose-6-phosphate isomerase-like protein (cupin superfamily)